MSDSEQTFLKDAIREVLPDLPPASKDILEEHLQSIGVQCYDDLQFVEESDLLTALRSVQARKLLAAWKLKCKLKRNSTPVIRKWKHQTDDSETDEVPLAKRAAIQDTYGCIKWDVKFLPVGETPESQQQKKEKLKSMSQQSDGDSEEVRQLINSTFYTQRKDINQGKSIKHLKEEWPFFFYELGMSVHFKELTGISLKETFIRNLDLKGKRLLNYMTSVCVNKSKTFFQTYTRLQMIRGEQSGASEDLKKMVLLLLCYFDEKEASMFFYVEDTCLAEEVQLEEVPLTPTVIVCGRSCYSARRYMLCLDKTIVHSNISSFISVLCLMFGSYYLFNIHYPTALGSSLEFLQRCFFSINPERGTKVEKNPRRLTVNPRVLTLIQELSDHEWRES